MVKILRIKSVHPKGSQEHPWDICIILGYLFIFQIPNIARAFWVTSVVCCTKWHLLAISISALTHFHTVDWTELYKNAKLLKKGALIFHDFLRDAHDRIARLHWFVLLICCRSSKTKYSGKIHLLWAHPTELASFQRTAKETHKAGKGLVQLLLKVSPQHWQVHMSCKWLQNYKCPRFLSCLLRTDCFWHVLFLDLCYTCIMMDPAMLVPPIWETQDRCTASHSTPIRELSSYVYIHMGYIYIHIYIYT